jgi:hypothetical protein
MSEIENFEETEDNEFEVLQVPRDCVKFPPPLNEDGVPLQGRVYNVECSDVEYCCWWGDIEIEYGRWVPEGVCPDCGKELQVDFGRQAKTVGIGSRGAGYHSTAWGRRRKQDMIRRSKKLESKQWDSVDHGNVVNPERVVNPTPGGPYHPDSIFNRHKKKGTKIIYKKGP